MRLEVRPSFINPGPGPLFLTGWGALVAFVVLACVGIGGWRWLLRRNRDRIEAERKADGR